RIREIPPSCVFTPVRTPSGRAPNWTPDRGFDAGRGDLDSSLGSFSDRVVCMRRLSMTVTVVAVVLAACGGGASTARTKPAAPVRRRHGDVPVGRQPPGGRPGDDGRQRVPDGRADALRLRARRPLPSPTGPPPAVGHARQPRCGRRPRRRGARLPRPPVAAL